MTTEPSALRRHLGTLVFVAALAVAAIVFRGPLRAWFAPVHPESMPAPTAATHGAAAASSGSASAADDEIDHYTCSMHPSVRQKAPGNCPICGMKLIPVTKAQTAQGVVTIDEARRQLIGVRTGLVVEAPMQRTLRAVGRVTYDESKLTDVTLKVRGFITKLLVSRTGERVSQGQILFQLYSPELFQAEQDYLLATATATGSAATTGAPRGEMLERAARQRLHLLGLSDAQLDTLAKKGAPSESIAFPSPASGYVLEKDVVEGAAVEAGMRLYRIAALDKVWVEADVYEADLPHVHKGQPASVSLDYLPDRAYDAKVAYVYPFVDPTTRAGRVRLELTNRELELRPGMYASVSLVAGEEPRLQVPASAVVYTGPRRLVFVDLGDGRFRPQEIRVGTEAGGMLEVLEGLKPGERVATSGVFLIAAEARISTAAKYWDAPADDAETRAPVPAAPATMNGTPLPSPTSATPKSSRPPAQRAASPKSNASAAVAPPAPAVVYTCPMHPEVQSDHPGQCPKCGMTLVPKSRETVP
jgi:Cu(I)/Ag(I) efflux system membrane fusion protein